MGWIFNILSCYGLIPLGASFLGALPLFFGVPSWTCLLSAPLLTWLIYFSLGERVDRRRGARINGISLLLLALCFTVLMVLGKGSVDSTAVGMMQVSTPMAEMMGSATVREHFPKQDIS